MSTAQAGTNALGSRAETWTEALLHLTNLRLRSAGQRSLPRPPRRGRSSERVDTGPPQLPESSEGAAWPDPSPHSRFHPSSSLWSPWSCQIALICWFTGDCREAPGAPELGAVTSQHWTSRPRRTEAPEGTGERSPRHPLLQPEHVCTRRPHFHREVGGTALQCG